MRKLMGHCSDRVGIPKSYLRFLLNGLHIPVDATTDNLGMEQNDVIDVFVGVGTNWSPLESDTKE